MSVSRLCAAGVAAAPTLLSCSAAPAPVTYGIEVDARTGRSQGTPLGMAPQSVISIRRGDAVTIETTGEIVYRTARGLPQCVGPWGALDDPSSRNAYCEDAKTGALVWKIGEDGPCSSPAEATARFSADRSGVLLFMVNDERGKYGDNSGAFRVIVTVSRR